MLYKKVILFLIIISILTYLIIIINDNNNVIDYVKTVGKIKEKKIESEDTIERIKNTNKFKHEKNFRIKLMYSYKVGEKEYNSYFYNDGKDEKFLKEEEYIPVGNMYNYLKYINIYYNKNKNYDSCVNLEEIKKRKKRIMYVLFLGLLFIFPFIFYI
jgi:hypothetical protein